IKGKRIDALEIAGEDEKFYPANAKIDEKSNTLLVNAKQVKKPIFVRYMFGNGTIGNLFDKSDLPVAPFRTDKVIYDLSTNRPK
ncbi:hypothetical protein LCGC14_2713700, partial [marine sediment metagenome]